MKFFLKPLFIAGAVMMPTAALSDEVRQDFGAVEAMNTCQALLTDSEQSMAGLIAGGWAPPSEPYASDLEESDWVAVQRGNSTILLMPSGTDVKSSYSGICTAFILGSSVTAATQIAVHLDVPATDFQEESEGMMHQKVSNNVRFVFEDRIIRVADINSTEGMMIFQYVPTRD